MAQLIENVFVKTDNYQTKAFGFNATAPLDNRTIITFDPTDKSEGKLYGVKSTSVTKDGKDVDFYNESLTYLYPGIIISILTGSVSSKDSKTIKTIRLDSKENSEVLQEWIWTEIGTGGDITNALTNYYTKEDVDSIITSVYKYKGSSDALPNIDNETGKITGDAKWDGYSNGDVYNITTNVKLIPYNTTTKTFENTAVLYPAGTNFAFVEATYETDEEGKPTSTIITHAHWDALGGVSALDELKSLKGSGNNDVIADGDILTASVKDGVTTISWQKAPTTTTITGSDTTSTPEFYTISDSDTTGVVYSKEAVDKLIETLTSDSLVWNDIEDNTTTEPTV